MRITSYYPNSDIPITFSNKVKVIPPPVLDKVKLPIDSNTRPKKVKSTVTKGRTQNNYFLPGDRCYYCDRELNEKIKFTRDHLIPKSKGGTDKLSNLVPCCGECNEFKADLTFSQFQCLVRVVKKIITSSMSLNVDDLNQILKTIKEKNLA